MFIQSPNLRRCRPIKALTLSVSALLVLSVQWTAAAPVSFQQAAADYNAGKFAQALNEFNSYEASYPSNALVHYYLALCHQGLGHMAEARSEYQWVSTNGDARLKSMAQSGLAQLSRVNTSVAYAGGSSQSRSTQSPQSSQPTSTSAAGKVKKIIEFYADW